MEQRKLDRINELARKNRTVGLTAAEEAERSQLRREYIDAVTGDLRSQLDHTYFVDEQGRKTKLRKKDGK